MMSTFTSGTCSLQFIVYFFVISVCPFMVFFLYLFLLEGIWSVMCIFLTTESNQIKYNVEFSRSTLLRVFVYLVMRKQKYCDHCDNLQPRTQECRQNMFCGQIIQRETVLLNYTSTQLISPFLLTLLHQNCKK